MMSIKEAFGFETIDEVIAYEEGRAAEESVFLKWIEEWDGSTNSGLGQLLMNKFIELKDKINVQ